MNNRINDVVTVKDVEELTISKFVSQRRYGVVLANESGSLYYTIVPSPRFTGETLRVYGTPSGFRKVLTSEGSAKATFLSNVRWKSV